MRYSSLVHVCAHVCTFICLSFSRYMMLCGDLPIYLGKFPGLTLVLGFYCILCENLIVVC